MLTVKDIRSVYPAKIAYTEHNMIRANIALDFMWEERCAERGINYTGDRSGSCKFAALLARSLFGGRLVGNQEHVFTVSGCDIIDLNIVQKDVIDLNHLAHVRFDQELTHKDYREALFSCLPRVHKWEQWVLDGMKK
jgi:hypothetical protein